METDISLKSPDSSVALIVGVTGMVGLSLAQALKQPSAPGSPWTVYGSSRRAPPAWFPPQAQLDGFVQLDALDREGATRALGPLATHVTHVFWVALAARDTEEENIAANSAMLENVLRPLTSAAGGSRLRHVALQTGTKHYFGPFLDPAKIHRIGQVMSELFHVEFVECPSNPMGPDWVERMKAKAPVWDVIVEKNGLFKTKLEEITTFEGVYVVANFKFQHVCSMNKSREYGFYKSVDTLKSVRKWVERLREMNIIPKD